MRWWGDRVKGMARVAWLAQESGVDLEMRADGDYGRVAHVLKQHARGRGARVRRFEENWSSSSPGLSVGGRSPGRPPDDDLFHAIAECGAHLRDYNDPHGHIEIMLSQFVPNRDPRLGPVCLHRLSVIEALVSVLPSIVRARSWNAHTVRRVHNQFLDCLTGRPTPR